MDPSDSADAVQRGGHARLHDPSRTNPSAIRLTHTNFLRAAADARYAHGGTTSPSFALAPLDRTMAAWRGATAAVDATRISTSSHASKHHLSGPAFDTPRHLSFRTPRAHADARHASAAGTHDHTSRPAVVTSSTVPDAIATDDPLSPSHDGCIPADRLYARVAASYESPPIDAVKFRTHNGAWHQRDNTALARPNNVSDLSARPTSRIGLRLPS